MRKVVLARGVESSILGFGCAPILGSVGARDAERALSCALELGVNHFDVARCYGYGDAERFVGRVLGARRESVVIVSKFGLEATGWARALRPVKPFARWLRARRGPSPADSEARVGRHGGIFLKPVPISAGAMEKSLEKSLRALGTDYLDILMLHEPDFNALPLEEIARAAENLKRQGKIRALGAAFYRSTEFPARICSGIFDVLQFDAPRKGPDYGSVKEERGRQTNVLFSPSRACLPGMDLPEALGQLWRDFPRSVVLSSMFNTAHIRSNVAESLR